MHAKALREALATFLGPAQFRRFVEQGYQGRLRFWQERLWDDFVRHHPEWSSGLALLAEALRICEIHGGELLPDIVAVFHGNRDYTGEYEEACGRLFPHAAIGPFSTEGAPFAGHRIQFWYCAECRRAYAVWERKGQ